MLWNWYGGDIHAHTSTFWWSSWNKSPIIKMSVTTCNNEQVKILQTFYKHVNFLTRIQKITCRLFLQNWFLPVYLMLLGWSLAPQYWLGEMQHESGTWNTKKLYLVKQFCLISVVFLHSAYIMAVIALACCPDDPGSISTKIRFLIKTFQIFKLTYYCNKTRHNCIASNG